MKQQFKFTPLATAIFTLLCGTSISSYAESTSVNNSADPQANKTTTPESYPGQQFFEQYYFDQSTLEAQQHPLAAVSSNYCQGVWITPISTQTKAVRPEEAVSTITADYGHYNPNGDSLLSGNVVIDQEGRQIRADKITIDQSQTHARAEGHVQMAQGGLLAQSDEINYNLRTQQGNLNNSFYISAQQHAYGHAEEIAKAENERAILKNATYTTCAPSASPAWKIQANHIELNKETGRGITKGTKLYIKNTPVLAVPYFNFPIDDRRTTGLLTPSLGFTNDGGIEFAAPIYLNLAPHYDATLTPRYIGNRGAMLDAEFRYLTENFGQGRVWGGYLSQDKDYENQDRKDLHFLHQWQINPQFSSNIEYHYASDKDFFADLDNNPNSKTDLNLRRAWELNYAKGIKGLTAQLKVEDFQTLDSSVPYGDRPYARLPQLLLNYTLGNPQGLQYEFNNDTAYFKKDIADFDLSSEPNGTRLYNDFAVRYNFRNPWAFVIPEVSVRNVNTFYDKDTKRFIDQNTTTTDSASQNISVTVPQVSLDAGLIFEKQGDYLQTLTPRLFYAYAPYEDQQGNPNFDSATASINYDQLFNPRRFYGNDRLEDNNFMSVGLSYSLFDPVGLERLKASVGQSFYFQDRRVNLNHTADQFDTEDRTGPIVSLTSQLSPHLSVNANAAWMSDGKNAQRDVQMYYTDDQGQLYNVGYFYRQEIPNRQDQYDQVVASFVHPLANHWRLMGHAQYDLDHQVAREYLLGVNYESCCWGLSLYARSYYNDLDNVNDPEVKQKRAVMIEFNLKGLGGFNNKLSSLLENRILGFNTIHQSWTQR